MENIMLTMSRLLWMVSVPAFMGYMRGVSTSRPDGPCTMTVNGGVINLWSVGKQNFPPRWSNESTLNPSLDPGLYYFDPCYQFSLGDGCLESLVCRNVSNTVTSIGLAGQTELFVDELNTPSMRIKGPQEIGKHNDVTLVQLICDENSIDTLTVDGMSTPGLYFMTLTSRCCCPGVCEEKSEKRLSFGSVLCILFVCAVVVYLVGGILYMKFARGASGIELIPNSGFWLDFPHLVAEGFNFVLTCGKGPESLEQGPGSGSRSDYESI